MRPAPGGASRLSRHGNGGRPLAPVRQVHLGLGSFFRAHQAWYTERSPDRDEWGIAGFTGRSRTLADTLTSQDNLYTLVTRSSTDDEFAVISSLSASVPASDQASFAGYLATPEARLLTLTVTEAGYLRGPSGDLDTDDAALRGDLAALRAGQHEGLRTVPGRVTAGLAARRAADAGPIAVVSCDNLPHNGDTAGRVVSQLAELVGPGLASWVSESVSFVNTVVDRITPAPDPHDRRLVMEATGRDDQAPVVTEPFSEWVLSGSFPGGRPAWESGGAVVSDTIEPFEHRKLWLLNGGHSLLAYTGSLRGHATVAEAVGDESCRRWLEQWWQEASAHLDLADVDLAEYRRALTIRFASRRIRHQLAQIAADGSHKLPIRVLPVVRAERECGRLPVGGLRILAGWLCHLRGAGAPVSDSRAGELTDLARGPVDAAAARLLRTLDPALAEDVVVLGTVRELASELSGLARNGPSNPANSPE